MPDNFIYDERDLLIQVSQGDESAFSQLFHAYRNKLYSYILNISGSKEMAEDAVHDVFLKLWTSREKLTEIQNLNAYIYRMAHNHARNGLKRMAKETLIIAELSTGIHYESSDPNDKLLRKEVLQFIHDAVDKLTPQQREVFKMSREEGLKQEEIAKRLGISVFTVKRHLTDALQSLRKEITDSYGSYGIALLIIYGLN